MTTPQIADEDILNVLEQMNISNKSAIETTGPTGTMTEIFYNTDSKRLCYRNETDGVYNLASQMDPTSLNSVTTYNAKLNEFLYINGPTGVIGFTVNVPGSGSTGSIPKNGDHFCVRNRIDENIELTLTTISPTTIENFTELTVASVNALSTSFTATQNRGEGVSYVYDGDNDQWMVSSGVKQNRSNIEISGYGPVSFASSQGKGIGLTSTPTSTEAVILYTGPTGPTGPVGGTGPANTGYIKMTFLYLHTSNKSGTLFVQETSDIATTFNIIGQFPIEARGTQNTAYEIKTIELYPTQSPIAFVFTSSFNISGKTILSALTISPI